MQHPALYKKLNDMEYERRKGQLMLQHMLMLLPLLLLGGQVYRHFGSIPLPALATAAVSYAIVVTVVDKMGRRDVLVSMRREGLINDGYKPPLF